MTYYLYVNGEFHSTFEKKTFKDVLRFAKGKSLLYGMEYKVLVKDSKGTYLCQFWHGYREL